MRTMSTDTMHGPAHADGEEPPAPGGTAHGGQSNGIDPGRIPPELRAELAELLPAALEVCRAVEELNERYRLLAVRWTTTRYPQLGETGCHDGDLDHELMAAAGLNALADYAMALAGRRTGCGEIERGMRLLAASD